MRAGASVKIERGKQCDGSGTKTTLKGAETRTCRQQHTASSRLLLLSSRWPTRPPALSPATRGSPCPPGRNRRLSHARPKVSRSCSFRYCVNKRAALCQLPIVTAGQKHLAACTRRGRAAEERDPCVMRTYCADGSCGAAAVPQLERAVIGTGHEYIVVQPCAAPRLCCMRPVRHKSRRLR